MYKLVAADDEVTELDFIKFCLSNSKLPLRLVGTATDGEETISLIDKVCPEIIILDIKMPRISGIEVGRYIAKKYPRAKVIMLTAYDKFDFACEALRFNAFDYLLKPVRPENLLAVLEKVIDTISHEKETIKRQESLLRKLRPAVFQKAITSLITVGRLDLPDLPEDGLSIDDHLLKQRENILIGCMALWEDNGTYLTDPTFLETAMTNLNANFKDGLFVITDDMDKLIFCSELCSLSYSKLQQIELLLKELGYKGILFVKKIEQLSDAPQAFRDVNLHCDYSSFWGQTGVFFIDNNYQKHAWDIEHLRDITSEILKKYFTNNSSTLKDDTYQILASLFDDVKRAKPDPSDCKNYFEELVTLIFWEFIEKRVEVELLGVLKTQTIEKIRQAHNYLEAFAAIEAFNKGIIDILLKPDANNADQIVLWIKNYLQANYQENITLEHLAEKVYLSPCYISRIFRQNTGSNFLQYLTAIRMERALELLQTGKYCVSEAAEAVGYKDASYFSQVFRKKYGVSPNEVIKLRTNMTISRG